MAQYTVNSPRHRQQTPLPTRVTRACERCRRNKSRCDLYRPCSLCLRANVECVSDAANNNPSRGKRARTEATPSVVLRGESLHSENSVLSEPSPISPNQDRTNYFGSHLGEDVATSNVVFTNDVEQAQEQIVQSQEDGEAGSAMGIARKIYRLGSQPIDERAVNAIPGADTGNGTHHQPLIFAPRRPIASLVKHAMPASDVVEILLEEYFNSVHWFSLVIYEPKFRAKVKSMETGFVEASDKSSLTLMSIVLGMAAWYASQKSQVETGRSGEVWRDLSQKLIENAELQLVEIMDQTRLSAVQSCILLGSYYLYHGRPNLSFSLLGATIRTAQVMGLYREPHGASFDDAEEKKRVWWTIYTWDRFASVTYGRPLGINDRDCNISMPLDVYESPHFQHHKNNSNELQICYSAYQRELNGLYKIASPIIEAIYRSPSEHEARDLLKYSMLVQSVTRQLWNWRKRLPPQLSLDMEKDCPLEATQASRAHRLQSLALQLTFDNLLIILHRPYLSQRIDSLRDQGSGTVRQPSHQDSSSSISFDVNIDDTTDSLSPSLAASASEQWWTAAIRTSKIVELPHLAQLAADSHLVAFLAINLFNSAILIAVMALSSPLSDEAQGAKRTITRVLRLQELLDKRSTLSMQSSAVLRNVVQLLLRREAEAILAPISAQCAVGNASDLPSRSDNLSVQETLNLPLDMFHGPELFPTDEPGQITMDKASRLNESLASVQRVFITRPNSPWRGMNHSEMYNASHHTRDEGRNYEWGQSNFGHGEGEMEAGLDPSGHGLYWIWDDYLGQN